MGECFGVFVGDVLVGVYLKRRIARVAAKVVKATGVKCRVGKMAWEVVPRRNDGGV